ncbi:hypothetical protein MLD38_038321 [Melastoma candidum]|uniref:Uncharacterized protein n=1 Tax=Melastoma candidum TaxID=119954 RepID=A0ACB9KYU4_9MYRT|nr:hypothetical protein MLD38_038321 [Melastoma candidum]
MVSPASASVEGPREINFRRLENPRDGAPYPWNWCPSEMETSRLAGDEVRRGRVVAAGRKRVCRRERWVCHRCGSEDARDVREGMASLSGLKAPQCRFVVVRCWFRGRRGDGLPPLVLRTSEDTPGGCDGEPLWGMGRRAGPGGQHHLRCRVGTSTWSRWGRGEGWFTTAPRGTKISGTMGITETVSGWRLGQGIAVNKADGGWDEVGNKGSPHVELDLPWWSLSRINRKRRRKGYALSVGDVSLSSSPEGEIMGYSQICWGRGGAVVGAERGPDLLLFVTENVGWMEFPKVGECVFARISVSRGKTLLGFPDDEIADGHRGSASSPCSNEHQLANLHDVSIFFVDGESQRAEHTLSDSGVMSLVDHLTPPCRCLWISSGEILDNSLGKNGIFESPEPRYASSFSSLSFTLSCASHNQRVKSCAVLIGVLTLEHLS